MKKVLFVATVVQKHINVFHLPFLKMFQEEGYRTYVAAANDTGEENVKISYCDEYMEVAFRRNPLHPGNIAAYRSLRNLIKSNDFDIIHCHTPVGGLIGRMASRSARKKGTRVFYTAHGFHFYKGAPLKNWLFYYPVEKFCSYFTDVLITINHEDYDLAKNKMKAKQVEYVPGVGVDVEKFKNTLIDIAEKRKEMGVPEDSFLLVSVGELNQNKNHEIVLRSMQKFKNLNLHYAIAGKGPLREYLQNLADDMGISDRLHLLGYRDDVAEIYKAGNVCVLPSIREGLPVAVIEGMACGLPIVATRNRGTVELIRQGEDGFLCLENDVEDWAESIKKLIGNAALCAEMSDSVLHTVEAFDVKNIMECVKVLYGLKQ